MTDSKIKGAILDRWILSESVNYNVTSPDVMARGNTVRYWQHSTDHRLMNGGTAARISLQIEMRKHY
jgi:hypothetical protein